MKIFLIVFFAFNITIFFAGCKYNDSKGIEPNMSMIEYQVKIFDSIQCKLTYEFGILRAIEHRKIGSTNLALTSYSFYDNGQLSVINEVLGDTIRRMTVFHENGQKWIESTDKDLNDLDTVQVLHGKLRFYYESGVLKEEMNYVDGIRQDTSKFYNCEGTMSSMWVYENGKCISKITF